MIIQHNMTAMNTNRQLGVATKASLKNMERLSSGYRINRAADDAAGLAISEKMRSQIRGLAKGVQNTEEGISLCQVADGALMEVCDILHRIRELSVQSANGTNTNEDRENLQDEVSQLVELVDDISENTEFNTRRIFCAAIPEKEEVDTGTGSSEVKSLLQVSTVQVSGIPLDESIQEYEFSSSAFGVLVNGDLIEWARITNNAGESIVNCADGEYSVVYNDIFFTFTVSGVETVEPVSEALAGTKVKMTVSDNSKPSIQSLSSEGYIPFSSYTGIFLSEEVYIKDTHVLTADENGVTLDDTYTVKWSDVYPPDENGKMTLVFGEGNVSGIVMGVQLNDEQNLDDIISELDGLTLNAKSTGHIVSDGAFSGFSLGGIDTTRYGFALSRLDIEDNFAIPLWPADLPAGLFQDQGFDVDRVYISNNTGNGHIDIDLADVSKSFLTFSIDGSQTTTFLLKQESQELLQEIIDRGGVVAKGEEITLIFEYNGIEMPLEFINRQKDFLLKEEFVDLLNKNDNDFMLRKAFSERVLDVAGIDFSTRGDITKKYSFVVSGKQEEEQEKEPSEEKQEEQTLTNGLWIQSGANEAQGMWLEIDVMSTRILGIELIDISTSAGASQALITVEKALAIILKSRSKIGAQQNRLEHTILWKNVAKENLTMAESGIRDADMAEEMVQNSKYNVLEQIGKTMLSQANQSKQGILNLFSK